MISLTPKPEYKQVPINLLRISLFDIRKSRIDEGKDILKASIRQEGIRKPLMVRIGDNGLFDIIDGQRRYIIAQELLKEGLKDFNMIPCEVYNLSPYEVTKLALIIAVTTELGGGIDPRDLGKAIKSLYKYEKSMAKVAYILGLDIEKCEQFASLDAYNPPAGEVEEKERMSKVLTYEENKAIKEKIKKNPSKSQEEITQEIQEKYARTREPGMMAEGSRYDNGILEVIPEFAREKGLSLKEAWNLITNEGARFWLEKEHYLVPKNGNIKNNNGVKQNGIH